MEHYNKHSLQMINKYKLISRIFFAVLWITLCWGFVGEELIHPIEKGRNAVVLLCDGVIMLMGLLLLRDRRDVLLLLSYACIAFFSGKVFNHESVMHVVNGSRDFLGLLFVVPILRYFFCSNNRDRFVASMDRQMEVFLWVQAVCITWQFVRYGANDHGGGTLGFGGSGTMSTLIYATSFYLISKRWNFDDYLGSLKANRKYVLLLYPTFLNETKISFIFLLFYFILLMPVYWGNVLRILKFSPLILIALIGVGYAYFMATNQEASEVLSMDYMEVYFFGDDLEELIEESYKVSEGEYDVDPSEWWIVDIPRFSKLMLVERTLKHTGGGLMLGAGPGQFKGGSFVKETRFAKEYSYLLAGSRPWLFFVVIQFGIIGVIWFLWDMIAILGFRQRGYPLALNMKLYISLMVLLSLFYNDSLRLLPYCMLLFYFITYSNYGPERDEAADADGTSASAPLQHAG